MKEHITTDNKILYEVTAVEELTKMSFDVMIGCFDKRTFTNLINYASQYGKSILVPDTSLLFELVNRPIPQIVYSDLVRGETEVEIFMFKLDPSLVNEHIKNESLKVVEKIRKWMNDLYFPDLLIRDVCNTALIVLLARRIMKNILRPSVRCYIRTLSTLVDYLTYYLDSNVELPPAKFIIIDYHPDTNGFLSLAPLPDLEKHKLPILTVLCHPGFYRDIQVSERLMFRIAYFEGQYYLLPLNVFIKVTDKFIMTPFIEYNLAHPIVRFARNRYNITEETLLEHLKLLRNIHHKKSLQGNGDKTW